MNENFELDVALQSSCGFLLDWPLSQLLLKNNADFPWLILVPRCLNVKEISDLSKPQRSQLIEEVNSASQVIESLYKPYKINIGTLGNIVKQLHVHLVARFKTDKLWPHGVWQAGLEEKPYASLNATKSFLLAELKKVIF